MWQKNKKLIVIDWVNEPPMKWGVLDLALKLLEDAVFDTEH